MALQIRRGTDPQRQSLSGVNTPAEGEPLYTVDTKKLFIGDGNTAGGVALGYYGAVNVAGQPSLSAAGNTDTLTFIAGENIILTTNDANDSITISAPRDLQEFNTGNINIFQNNILGLNSNEDIIIQPSGTGQVDISSNLTVAGTTFGTFIGNITGDVIGNVTGNVTGSAATVTDAAQPAITSVGTLTGLTVNGNITAASITGNFDGQLNGSVFRDDSTSVLVDAIDGKHYGSFLTEKLSIIDSTITLLDSNLDLVLDLNSAGIFIVRDRIRTDRITLVSESNTSGMLIINQNTTNNSFAIGTIHNNQSTSVVPGNKNLDISGPLTGSTVVFNRGRGSISAPQPAQNNDEISTIDFTADDGLTFLTTSLAVRLRAVVDGAVSPGITPGRFEFLTSDSAGANSIRLTVNSSAVTASVPFKLPVVADDSSRTSLVPTPTQGMMIFIQSGTTPAATNQAQVFDGTNWVNL